MDGALQAGGWAVGVLAEQLLRMTVASDCREPIREGRLALISLVDPSAGFNIGNAMQRNKVVYAFADAALIVSADHEKGGTWAGAVEQLERFGNHAIYVRTGPSAPAGNQELLKLGALAWPAPKSAEELQAVLLESSSRQPAVPQELPLLMRDQPLSSSATVLLPPVQPVRTDSAKPANAPPAARIFAQVASIICEVLAEPQTDKELASILNVSLAQTRAWLKALLKERLVEKMNKPIRYRASKFSGEGLL